ncbi:MAG: GNAT family N-acetyltransferase, partial [Pseudomonadota bacterium]
MRIDAGRFTVRLAGSEADIKAAQRLRYRIFVEEMGAVPSEADRMARRETDRFDPYFEHLLLIDNACERPEIERGVVGAYRLMRDEAASEGIGFYGASEYDLSCLAVSGRRTVELGRSCVDAQYRGGAGMHLLWTGLGEYVTGNGIEIMFGVASFHGRDPEPIAQALSYLHHNHLAPEDLRVRAVAERFTAMDILPADQVERPEAMRQLPALIKA